MWSNLTKAKIELNQVIELDWEVWNSTDIVCAIFPVDEQEGFLFFIWLAGHDTYPLVLFAHIAVVQL